MKLVDRLREVVDDLRTEAWQDDADLVDDAIARIAELERERDEARAELTNRIASIMHNPDVDGDSLAAALIREGMERERKTSDALRSEVEQLRPWARFGARAFEDFWQDGYPGDLEGGDLQEMARECGLLGRTADVDAGATHADGCDWQPGMHVDDCDCWAPLLAPYTQEDSNA